MAVRSSVWGDCGGSSMSSLAALILIHWVGFLGSCFRKASCSAIKESLWLRAVVRRLFQVALLGWRARASSALLMAAATGVALLATWWQNACLIFWICGWWWLSVATWRLITS